MTTYLISPFTRKPVAAIEEDENGKTLKMVLKSMELHNLKKGMVYGVFSQMETLNIF